MGGEALEGGEVGWAQQGVEQLSEWNQDGYIDHRHGHPDSDPDPEHEPDPDS